MTILVNDIFHSHIASGEWTWKNESGRYVSDAWVSDGGKYYYIDLSGCMMKNNYAPNGAWVGDDGAWDPYTAPLTEVSAPLSDTRYGTDPYWTFSYAKNNDGSWTVRAVKTYSFGHSESYIMEHQSGGCYSLTKEGDSAIRAQLTVTPDHNKIRISQGGSTEVCEIMQ